MLCGSRAARASTSASETHVVGRGDDGVEVDRPVHSERRGTVRSGAPAHSGCSLSSVRLDPAAVLCDLDGVVWLAHQPIPGSVEAIARLRRPGRRVVFVTNNSSARIAEQEAALAAVGIPATGDVLTSAVAAAALVEPGERVLVCGGAGIVEALAAPGCGRRAGRRPVRRGASTP